MPLRVPPLDSIASGLNPVSLELHGAGEWPPALKGALILAGAEIDGTESPKTPAAPLCKDGAATPILAARIPVNAAITALFCMVAAVF
jgi:hypothetical protein